ncbi:MAG TPA: hypothetical protein VES67_00365 [Vicinamibacterales bacterium]|nr:hypothetical protein [Vicinamibacterales bacterium]
MRNNGRVELTGLVSGLDKVRADEDISYRGVLQFTADLDLCDVRDGVGGESKLCSITVAGAGPMNVELEVYEGNRGGYVKVSQARGSWTKSTSGSCDALLIGEEFKMFPNDSQATIFNGNELTLKSGPLQVGQYRTGRVLFEVLRVVRR